MRQTASLSAFAISLGCLLLGTGLNAFAELPVNQNYFGAGVGAYTPSTVPAVSSPNAAPQSPARIEVDETDSSASIITPAPVNRPIMNNAPQSSAWPTANPSIPGNSFGAANGGPANQPHVGKSFSRRTPHHPRQIERGDDLYCAHGDKQHVK